MIRVLEFGPLALFARARPEATRRFWTGDDPHDSLGEPIRRWGARRLLELRRAIGEGSFDLVACHVPIRRLLPGDPRILAYEMVRRVRSAPLVVLDMNDRTPLTATSFRLLERCRAYFKRELPVERDRLLPRASERRKQVLERHLAKIRPISIGLAPWRIADLPDPLPEKTVDVFYSGTFDLDVRARGAVLLERLATEGVRVDLSRERLGRQEYLRRTARAHLVWSPAGLGWQCFRHLEASAAASVPVMNRPAIEQVAPLRPGEHCFHYEPEGDDLLRVIREALRDEGRLRRMGRAARHHVLANHTHADCVAHVLDAAGVP